MTVELKDGASLEGPAGELPATVEELIICGLAAGIDSDTLIHIGVTTPLGYIAAALAKATHAPGATLYALNISGYTAEPFPLTVSFYEAMALQRGPMVRITDMYTHIERRKGVGYEPVIPVQMDRYGAVNISQIGEPGSVKVRLPGVGGLDTLGAMVSSKTPFYTLRHNKRTFVEKVDFVTMKRGTHAAAGPGRLYTNLGVFDFEGSGGTMRACSLHPGVEHSEVAANTSFPIEAIDSDLPTTEPPSDEQLRLIRDVLDPLCMRDLEAVSEQERRTLLRGIIEQERTRFSSRNLAARSVTAHQRIRWARTEA